MDLSSSALELWPALSPLRPVAFFEDPALPERAAFLLVTDFDPRPTAAFPTFFFFFADDFDEVFFAGFFGDLVLPDFLFEALFF
jgi:hypothetical protein